MKFKLVPAAPDAVDFVAEVQRAVPLVPGTEDDCCARLMRRLDFPSRDVARTWLTFLRALELVEETPSGFRRLRTDATADHLREAFVRRVYGADEIATILRDADEPLTLVEVFDAFRDRVPVWEHHKNPSRWESIWHDRVGDVLDWLVLLDAVERTADGYAAR